MGCQLAVRGGRAAALTALARPFTLVAPALGVLSGAVTAAGALPPQPWSPRLAGYALLATIVAIALNAGNNALNQIYDVEIDRINKPQRPLAAGRLTRSEARRFAAIAYTSALLLAWPVAPAGRHDCFWIVLAASAATLVYSVPPVRTKQRGWWANLTIAVPRGVLLKVAGWSSVRAVSGLEPWFIGAVFGLFLLGATTTKDFADIRGDAAGSCRTLPVRYGVRRAAWMIAPSFVLPFVLMSAGSAAGVLTGNPVLLQILAFVLSAYGIYICFLMLRRPEELAMERNHVSWLHTYRMLFVAQIGFAVAYLF